MNVGADPVPARSTDRAFIRSSSGASYTYDFTVVNDKTLVMHDWTYTKQ